MPERILDRQVGGNTTYARNVARGLYERGVDVGRIPAGRNPLHTAVRETLAAITPTRDDTVLHYVADTGPLLPSKTPAVVTVHGVASRWISTARTASQEFVWRRRVTAAIENTHRVITVSNSSADDVSDVFNIPRDNISVIHHGIDTEIFRGDTAISEEVKNRLPKDFALYLGNIEPRKNLLALIDAINRLSKTSSAIPLVISGRPAWNYEDTLRAIEGSPNVIYLGFVDDNDRRALMQRCTVFVFPSLYEGFGFPILEAMAAGAPVLTTDRGSLAEVRGPGRLIHGTDSDSISDSIRAAIGEDDWLRNAPAEGRDWANRFSWDNSVERHINVYEELLK
jgi:glycosyltransferase involved in cell wall biosynthesis